MSTISNERLEKLSLQRDELLAALEDIIAYNVQYATDKYGDASKAETMACVRRCREAPSQNSSPHESEPDMSIIMLVFIGLCFMFAAIVKQDGLMFTDALILLCSAFLLAKEEKRRG
ncbi:hypothetical protein EHJ06_21465 [Cronobacter malonaticus]|uniref:hypothetical protein n=1 Tax=Cronobacter malonaticus TaxID=413503 RepID=UPI00192A2B58|nr:hypothetical protein [Cronobacter malonaticus]NCH03879.1 hypothetical protein [Cronobacter malonaticus]NCH03894.1 hypothetical protein [Cronobacter malonaticus]